MKILTIAAIAITVFFGGCSIKGDTVTLGEYKPSIAAQKESVKNIKLASFTDERREKPLIATIKDSGGHISKSIFATDDLGAWLEGAVSKELASSSVRASDISTVVISASIKKFDVQYTTNPTSTKNIQMQIHVEMNMQNNGNSLKKDFFLKEDRYAAMLTDSAELTPHIQDMLSQVAKSMSAAAIKWGAQ